MSGSSARDETPLPGNRTQRWIGHKGADAITHGNTIASFEAAVEAGVDMVEFDVLRAREGRLIVAHDYRDAMARRPLDLSDALSAFLDPPLDQVEIDCDLKLPGREAELAGALAGHGLVDRAMVSTMEVESLVKLARLEPDLRLGWTYPKTRRDWTSHRWLRPGVQAAVALMRRQFPKAIGERARELRLSAVWAYHPVVTRRAVEAADEAGIELIAWTVDDLGRMTELIKMGVHGICSNDPRLFPEAERAAAGEAPAPAPQEPDVMEELDEEAKPAEDEVPEDGDRPERRASTRKAS
ncbi:MAG TPA: glycerophosphodiester phosphodiesterase [Solirubrobacterales bacterium]|jgi:glycerophosphoryl diester phosphodiesterase|nr:glycerophosphodiester phosphodiesterase [Solirubrobacterales bacterium]